MSDRYRRQKSFSQLGESGQQRLAASRVVICGVGALGSMVVERLCRAGVGSLTLIDRDWVEWDNLPRQTLYTEEDAGLANPKAKSCTEHLRRLNSETAIDFHVTDLHSENIELLIGHPDLIIDGTDNFETRYLINDYACKHQIPWIHGGVVGASGQTLTILPGRTACLRCLLPDPPPAEQMQTCDSAGVLGPAVGIIANWQAMEALKLLASGPSAIDGDLRVFDCWEGEAKRLRLHRLEASENNPGCPACVQRQFEFLRGERQSQAKVLCGRNTVQIVLDRSEPMALEAIASRLASECRVTANAYFLKFQLEGLQWTLFRDGRALLTGTEDVELARKLFARYIGT
ncbi:ThiF family adenylyltransferase [Pirellulaceae bacterium SH467]